MVSLIIPAAGKSSRYPGVKPKWMLTHPSGCLMINAAISGLDTSHVEKIYVTVLKEHLDNFECEEGIRRSFLDYDCDVHLVVLEEETSSQPETVYETIRREQISGPIFVKDSDNYFTHKILPGNYVTVADVNGSNITKAGNKSYVTFNEKGLVSDIVEKKIISSFFCTGGYSFEDANLFCETFESLSNDSSLFISHLIQKIIFDNGSFSTSEVFDIQDWGTLSDWDAYKKKYATIFIDMDGVLVKNSGRYIGDLWGTTDPLENNVSYVRKLAKSGKVKIIITTSRDEKFSNETEAQLKRHDIPYHQIIYGLPHAKRIVINDFAKSNPYRCCDAVNIKRNADHLDMLLKEIIEVD